MRDIAIFLIAFLLLAFESPLLHEAHLAAYAPDMALLVVLYVGLSSRFERGLFLALGLGLLKDGFVMASPVGLYMVIMVIAFMVTYRLSQRLALRSILGVMLLAVVASFGASLLELFLSLVFDRHFGDSSRGPSLVFGAMLPEALVTAPFAPAVFWALDRLDGFLARKSRLGLPLIATPPADLRRGRLGMALTVFTLLFIGLEARLFYLQILRGEDFRERARISVISRERIPARRGEIRDREGRVLARNVPAYRIRVTPHYVLRADREEVLGRLASIVGLSADERLELDEAIDQAVADNEVWEPIALGRELVADTCPVDASPLELRDEVERSFVCPQDGDVFEPIDPKATYCPHDRTRLKWTSDAHEVARCTRCKRRFLTRPQCPDHDTPLQVVDHNLRCPLCKRTYTNEVAALQAQLYELPGVEIDTHFRRDYPMQYDAAHLVGYMNRVTAADRERWPGVYGLQDVIGRSGVERALEEELRGERGESLSIKDAGGHRATSADAQVLAGEAEFARAVPGLDVRLTLDMQLQKEVRKAFRYYASGAAVVVDPRTGDVLAAYSKPGFDPNELTGGVDPVRWAEIRDNPYAPLMNKALTPFAPGSVYKIVTGLAALVESIVSPDVTIDCTGYYEYKGRRFHCHNREGHGPMDLVGAFVHSCDVYFYRVGEMLGIDRLATYGRAFGFGEPTGVEVSERTGLVPTRRWHAEETALGWQPGFTLSTAIGQGSLTASPLQVARAFAAVANGGNLLQLHLVSKLVDEHGNVVHQSTPQVVGRLPGTPEQLSIIREALVRVVNDPNGTARDVALQSIVIAGKTGTAEAAQVRSGVSAEMAAWLKEDHAWFAAYAPAEDPQVVVVTFVEHGGSGSRMAGPIAQRIISSWMRLGRYKSQDPDAHEEVPADDELPPADEPQEAPVKARRALGDVGNWLALGIVILLVAISLVSQRNADWYSGDSFYDLQVVWYMVGGIIFVLAALVELRLVERASYVALGVCVVLLLLTTLFGTEVNYSKRWLRFAGLNLQASELTKLGVILGLSRFFHVRKERLPGAPPKKEGPYLLRELWRPALMVGVPTLLVLLQPDLGTSLLIVLVALTMLFWEGLHRRTLVLVLVAGLVGVPVAWEYGGLRYYQKKRVVEWINADWAKVDTEAGVIAGGAHLQSEQAIWAIGSGEFWGHGSRAGGQSRLKYLPEMHTDMIIATFAEEQGFIGCSLLLALFWVLVMWGLRTASEAKDRYCALLSVGVVAMIGWQVFINIGMVAGLLPIVGLPLPFLSYGGSAALTTMLSLGLLFNVALRRGRL